MAAEGTVITHRSYGGDAAVVFVHGFSGDPHKTWGNFPSLLARRRNLRNWDVFSLGFPTSLGCDIVGVWKANPDLPAIAGGIVTRLLEDAALSRYRAVALVAHSMGGLAVQRALVDSRSLAERTDSVILFGTPSGGLKKAAFFRFWKRQLRDMAIGSPFINDLRERWKAQFGANRPFQFLSVAGDQDEFVPRTSSIDIFDAADCDHVPGDHLSLVKPASPARVLAVDLVERKLTRGEVGGASARRAAERAKAREAVNRRLANAGKLDDEALRDLALDLDRIGELEKSIEVSRNISPDFYDGRGVLGGRLKRRWLANRFASDAKESLAVYSDAYQRAARKRDAGGAFYTGINVAFLQLAFRRDLEEAGSVARQVLRHCTAAEGNPLQKKHWLLATQGEAHLLLQKPKLAIRHYADAADATDAAWEKDSMYQQATRIASILNDKETAAELARVFDREG